jgi:hypothetical protein
MKLKLKLLCLICVFAIPVVLPSCKESIDVEEIASPNVTEGTKPSEKEIKDFKKWYTNLESSPNARIGGKDEISEIQEVELWSKAISHKQSNSANKLLTLPLLDFKDKKQTKLQKLYLTETNGIKNGFKMDIKSSNGKSDKFTGTIIVMSLDEKSKREYKYKDNKLESKKNLRVADFGNQDLPEVTVTAYVNHGGTLLLVSLMFGPANSMPSALYYMVEPCNDSCAGVYIDLEYDPALVEATIDWLRDKLLAEAAYHLKPAEMAILRGMSTSNIVKFANNYLSAQTVTNQRFPSQANLDYGHANAFKHVMFAALHVKAFGANIALQLTNAHESGQSGCGTSMDFANNNIGLNLNTASYSNFDALANGVYQMAKTGQLWTVGGNCIHQAPF